MASDDNDIDDARYVDNDEDNHGLDKVASTYNDGFVLILVIVMINLTSPLVIVLMLVGIVFVVITSSVFKEGKKTPEHNWRICSFFLFLFLRNSTEAPRRA